MSLYIQIHLGYTFNDPKILDQALTHPSYLGGVVKRQPRAHLSNQRLEFLGDSILGLCLSVYLMEKYPQADEGELTQLRSQFVCGKTLASIGNKLGVGPLMFKEKTYRLSEKDIADAVEALIGAVYQDGGILNAEQVILNLFAEYLDNGLVPDLFVDHKSQFQKLVHAKYRKTEPTYKIEEAQDGYVCKLYVKDKLVATGTGSSKKKAQFNAAENGCKNPVF